jgi:hypothetical protein
MSEPCRSLHRDASAIPARRRRGAGRWVLASAVFVPCVMMAQRAPSRGTPNAVLTDTDAALARVYRVDSLVVARKAELEHVRATLRNPERWVDVSGSLFHIRLPAQLEAAGRAGAASATASLGGTVSADLRAQLKALVPVFVVDSTRGRRVTVRRLWMRPDTSFTAAAQSAPLSMFDGVADAISGQLVVLAEELAARAIDSTVTRWLRSPRVALGTRAEEIWEQAAVEVASTSSRSLRACVAGDREACLTSLGLPPHGEASFAEWYAPEDYPSIMRLAAIERTDTVGFAAHARCRRSAAPAACDTAVAHLRPERVPLPLSATTRALFLGEVLRAGGEEAFARLRSAPGSLRERMAIAAGGSLNAAVDRWLAHLTKARPSPMAVSPATFLLSLAWSVALASLAMSRRTVS